MMSILCLFHLARDIIQETARYVQTVVTATVDLEDVRAYKNSFRSRCEMVRDGSVCFSSVVCCSLSCSYYHGLCLFITCMVLIYVIVFFCFTMVALTYIIVFILI